MYLSAYRDDDGTVHAFALDDDDPRIPALQAVERTARRAYLHATERADDAPLACPFCSYAFDLHGADGACPPPEGIGGIEAARLHAAHEAARAAAGCGPVIAPVDDSSEPY